jgi:hypothetical protein|uniref:Uncharacterized protein n=1 Tax=viral metagenome TaxID=1070528 RepID=A0A6C0IUX3_9ZZZZ
MKLFYYLDFKMSSYLYQSGRRRDYDAFVQMDRRGIVTIQGNSLVFNDNGKQDAPVTFHTHYKTNESGGFQAPSRTDIHVFLCIYPQTHTHYILTSMGVYIMKKGTCNMSERSKQKIIKFVRQLQAIYDPLTHADEYHSEFMAFVNNVCPQAFHVQYVVTGGHLPLPLFNQSAPKKKCLQC